MVDIDPTQLGSKYTPREPTLVDAVAEASRIADQQMRSNPLKNARVDSGLTLWQGNYGGSLVWIGEITPADKNQFDQYGNNKRQRAFVLQRDDPNRNFAITMYDFNPQAGVPLNQRLTLSDINGRRMYQDGINGGLAFPDRPIVMYPRVNIESGLADLADAIIWSGSGNITGTLVEFRAGWATGGGTPTVTTFVRVRGIGGTVVDSPTRVLAGPNNIAETIDISAIYNNGDDFAEVEWHLFRSAGTGSYYPRPQRVRNYSNLW